jgi:hypothetical protein
MTSAKNLSLTPAGQDLGLGDDLANQVNEEILARRKASLLASQAQPAAFGALGLGPSKTPGTGNTGGYAYGSLMQSQGGLGA